MKDSVTTKLDYRTALNRQQFDRECGVKTFERYDDCILLTTGCGLKTKVPHDFFDKHRPMPVREGNAP